MSPADLPLQSKPQKPGVRPWLGIPGILVFGSGSLACCIGGLVLVGDEQPSVGWMLFFMGIVLGYFTVTTGKRIAWNRTVTTPAELINSACDGVNARPRRKRGVLVVSLIAAGVLGYVGSTLGWFDSFKAALQTSSQGITHKLLETKCEVVGPANAEAGIPWLDYTITVSGKLRNRTASTITAWVRAEVHSPEQKVLLFKTAAFVIGPNAVQDIQVAFPEAEQRYSQHYKTCRIMLERVE